MKLKMFFPILCILFFGCSKNSNNSGGISPQADPQISISDVNLFEGNSGYTTFPFTVTLDHASSKTITVSYSTVDGSAAAGSDYIAVSNQTLTFQPNETSKTININVVGDSIEESDEQFTVVLSNAINATIAKSTGTGTIRNDDNKVTFNNTGYDAPTSYPGYNLVWSDEFNGNSLDTSVWSYETGNSGWGNNELEYYTSGPNNLTFQDGKLVIHALKQNYGSASYTSARIKTQGKKEFKYGRIDIRAILPKGRGIWPALWMLGSNINTVGWPACGETDIMELLGQNPQQIIGSFHWKKADGSEGTVNNSYSLTSGDFSQQFHVFSLLWDQNGLQILVDNQVYVTGTKTAMSSGTYPFDNPFFFIFNIAVGGNWPGSPDASTYFPQWMIVDYIRVYQ